MSLETSTYISDLVVTNPTGSDPKAEGPGHFKLIKSTLKNTFPAVAGAVSASHIELSYSAGITGLIQAQINNEIAARTNADLLKANLAGATFTGPVLLPAQGVSPAEAARKDYADGLAFSSALPGQAGNSGKFVTTNGTVAIWSYLGFPITAINGNTDAVAGNTYLIYGACTLTLPAITGSGQQVGIIVLAGVTNAVIAPAGADKIRTVAGSMTVDSAPFDKILTDKGATYGWV